MRSDWRKGRRPSGQRSVGPSGPLKEGPVPDALGQLCRVQVIQGCSALISQEVVAWNWTKSFNQT